MSWKVRRMASSASLIFTIFTLQATWEDGGLQSAQGENLLAGKGDKAEIGAPGALSGSLSGTVRAAGQEDWPQVACFHLDFRAGGTLYQTYRTIECLQSIGVDVEMILVSQVGALADKVPENVKVTILQKDWEKFPVIGRLMPLRLVIAAFQLRRYLRASGTKILWSSASKVNLCSILANGLRGRSSKLVLTITTDIYHRYPGARDRRVTPFLIRKFYAAADMILTVSDGLTGDILDLSEKHSGRVKTIYPPLDLARIRQDMAEAVDHPWFGDASVPVVLAVGRISVQKDFATMLRAIAEANKTRPVRLAIIGPGCPGDVAALKALARELGIDDQVDFLGLQRNPYKYMARSGCFLLTSLWEGFGIVIAEALICGCPVVSTDCRHGPDEILDGGKYGELVPIGDPVAISQAVLRSLSSDSDSHRLSRQSRAKLFDYDVSAARYREVLNALRCGGSKMGGMPMAG